MSFQIRQPRLFSVDKYQARANYEPGEWEKQPDIVWHGSESPVMPEDKGESSASTGGGFHVGSKQAAQDRVFSTPGNSSKKVLHPLQIRGQFALPPDKPDYGDSEFEGYSPRAGYRALDIEADRHFGDRGAPGLPVGRTGHMTWNDHAANYSNAALSAVEEHELNVPYTNEAEAPGTVSYRVPRENVLTWAESVHEDPNAPNWAKAARDRGFDLSHPMNTQGTEYPREGGQQLSLDLGPSANSTTVGYDQTAVDRHVAAIEHAKGTKPRIRRGW